MKIQRSACRQESNGAGAAIGTCLDHSAGFGIVFMKKITILLLLSVCAAFSLSAQTGNVTGNSKPDFPHHELGISYGIHPLNYQKGSFFIYFTDLDFKIKTEDALLVGALNLYYQYNIRPKHSIGITASYLYRKDYRSNNNLSILGCNAFYKYTYVTFPKCAFYLKAGTGHLFVISSSGGVEYWPSFQLTPFGVRLGEKNAANIELGIGPEGVFKLGYNCAF